MIGSVCMLCMYVCNVCMHVVYVGYVCMYVMYVFLCCVRGAMRCYDIEWYVMLCMYDMICYNSLGCVTLCMF